jgi:hypothetical protein
MSALLVKFKGDYGDEFDCQEFAVFDSQENYDRWINGYTKYFSENNGSTAEVYFGTNEYLEFNSLDDLMSQLEIHEITDEEADIFTKYFGNRSFGTSGVFSFD